MKITEAVYVVSNADYTKCPAPTLPEYAFIGRSNVGKSSLINMLTGKRDLAKTSPKPGKTQLINHFRINRSWYLVDLPGYGYAKISKTEREKWQQMIGDYLYNRPNLICTFVLVDSRHAPQAADLAFIEKLGTSGVAFHIVFTKTDKLKPEELNQNLEVYQKTLLETWEELPAWFITSAESGKGQEELLNIITAYNEAFTQSAAS